MPNARTATIAVSSMRMEGRWLARTISQPEVAVRAIPEVVAMPPSSPAPSIAPVTLIALIALIAESGPAEVAGTSGVVMRGLRRGCEPDVAADGCVRRRG